MSSANSLYFFASRESCPIAAKEPKIVKIEKNTIIPVWNQNLKLCFEGLKTIMANMIGNTKTIGVYPNAPMRALMSPKKGSMAAKKLDVPTNNDRPNSRGLDF